MKLASFVDGEAAILSYGVSECPPLPFPPPPIKPRAAPTSEHMSPNNIPRTIRLGRLILHRPIVTGQPQLGWVSVAVLSLVWFSQAFHIFAGGICLVYTVKRYIADPRLISLITTLGVIIMLGPFISYMSDNVWTRLGRRRPFVLIAFSAGAIAMGLLAFLPEATAALGLLAERVGLPSLTEVVLLIGIIILYTTLYDFSTPSEALFIECVPPHQRGRFFAIRNALTMLCSLFFYQIFWPIYDAKMDLFAWSGHAAGLVLLTGEQLTYLVSGILFAISMFILTFLVREVKRPDARNLRIGQLGVLTFAKSYVKDVFLSKDCYPFYILAVVPSMATAVWGSFGALMQTDQFEYSKGAMALMGLPGILIGILLITPFAGWYSDARPAITNKQLSAVAGGSLAACLGAWVYYRGIAPEDPRELPAIVHCFGLTTLISLGGVGLFVSGAELISRKAARSTMRIAIVLLAMIANLLVDLFMLVYIYFISPGRIPTITSFMMVMQFPAVIGALLGVCITPMIYDYVPRNRIGTINSGRGLLGGALTFGVANLGAFWIVWWSDHVHRPTTGSFDYASLYLLQLIFYVPAIAAVLWFRKGVVTGKLPPLGVLEVEANSNNKP